MITAVPGARVVIERLTVRNKGWRFVPVAEGEEGGAGEVTEVRRTEGAEPSALSMCWVRLVVEQATSAELQPVSKRCIRRSARQ